MNKYVVLVKLMDNLCNFSHAVSFSDELIYDLNYNISLPLVKLYLDLICASSDEGYLDS